MKKKNINPLAKTKTCFFRNKKVICKKVWAEQNTIETY
jgi:hypothetical protein